MIKELMAIKNKLILAAGAILVFLISYILQLNFVVCLLLLALFTYFKYLGLKRVGLLNLSLLFVIIFSVSYFIVRHDWSLFYIPFCLIPMLSTILFGELEPSLLMTVASSVAVTSITGANFYLGILFLVSGISSSILVLNVRRRIEIIRAGLLVGLIQLISLVFIDPLGLKIRYFNSYITIFLNGIVSSIIVIGILPVFEYLFKTVTNISLLELTDFNHPLLQRLILEAPGTYHHSLIVGNLSEAACGAIGTNALLARIGAYYHDIGKLNKPEYFSENQDTEKNKHDTLSPSMSKMVIINHVKEGAELAKKYKLSPPLIDFILQHHGTSLAYYFYRRALENLEEDQEIKEEGFRYSGPKPHTKETAVVLLADSVEAATRALKEPSPEKIKEVVRKIINNKFIDGQLDDCDLTLKDLDKIAAVFIRILSSIYHSRVTYPERVQGQNSENNHKKSTKENILPSPRYKKDNS